ncbi:hypothetical protein AAT19DRAFT_11979 [Rhodotorula toruloides]|uniref:Uncharacterized protein n=1 Tax=Rhodotorula toruloides TaxID=5286 RepID=A0A2T0AEW9_RHOTO|nr:hypothetical protein AAT19DRAFT_11979 [Rhodotorula toruloides]
MLYLSMTHLGRFCDFERAWKRDEEEVKGLVSTASAQLPLAARASLDLSPRLTTRSALPAPSPQLPFVSCASSSLGGTVGFCGRRGGAWSDARHPEGSSAVLTLCRA